MDEFYYISEERDARGGLLFAKSHRGGRSSNPSHHAVKTWIRDAASEVVRRIVAANGGVKPRSLEGWLESCRRIGVDTVAIGKHASFTAFIMEWPTDHWTIFYNCLAPEYAQSRYIAHELAEYVTRATSWAVMPPLSHALDGHYIRHQIAKRVEELTCPKTDPSKAALGSDRGADLAER